MEVFEIKSNSGRIYPVNYAISKKSFDKLKLKISESELINRKYYDYFPLKFNNLLVLSADFLSVNGERYLKLLFKVLEKYNGEVNTIDIDFSISEQLTYLFIEFDTPALLEEAFLDLSN